ncbi:MAG: hypothetical protein V4490_03800 [Pseudomonadota bacterium]
MLLNLSQHFLQAKYRLGKAYLGDGRFCDLYYICYAMLAYLSPWIVPDFDISSILLKENPVFMAAPSKERYKNIVREYESVFKVKFERQHAVVMELLAHINIDADHHKLCSAVAILLIIFSQNELYLNALQGMQNTGVDWRDVADAKSKKIDVRQIFSSCVSIKQSQVALSTMRRLSLAFPSSPGGLFVEAITRSDANPLKKHCSLFDFLKGKRNVSPSDIQEFLINFTKFLAVDCLDLDKCFNDVWLSDRLKETNRSVQLGTCNPIVLNYENDYVSTLMSAYLKQCTALRAQLNQIQKLSPELFDTFKLSMFNGFIVMLMRQMIVHKELSAAAAAINQLIQPLISVKNVLEQQSPQATPYVGYKPLPNLAQYGSLIAALLQSFCAPSSNPSLVPPQHSLETLDEEGRIVPSAYAAASETEGNGITLLLSQQARGIRRSTVRQRGADTLCESTAAIEHASEDASDDTPSSPDANCTLM